MIPTGVRGWGLGVSLLLATGGATCLTTSVEAQRKRARDVDRFDDTFRKYSKRYFGPAFDWRHFKAQGLAESNLDPNATSWVGARGIMQLMPSTFREVRSKNPTMTAIDDPEWNIAAGIFYDRKLWLSWESDSVESDRLPFMFASYNAGRLTILRAQDTARTHALDHRTWRNIESVAPRMKRERMVSYYAFPQEHWRHLRTTNVVESPFDAVRLRTSAAKRYNRIDNATAMIWRLLLVVEQRFRKLNAPERCRDVYDNKTFVDGELRATPITREKPRKERAA